MSVSRSYETTSGANIAAYTEGRFMNTNQRDVRESNFSLGKSGSSFENTAQRYFDSRTADEVRNAQLNVASTTQMRTEIRNSKQKVDMVSSRRAASSDVEALHDVKYQKYGGADLRRTNLSLGTQKQHLATENGAAFLEHGAAVYTAPVQQQEVS